MKKQTYRAGDLPLGAYVGLHDAIYDIVVDSHSQGVEWLKPNGETYTLSPDFEVAWNELCTACVACRIPDPVDEDGHCPECAAEYRDWRNQGSI